jgi:rRNA maturation RNase YbeY
MSRAAINFFIEDTTFHPKQKIKLRQWIKASLLQETQKLKELNFIFCSDAYLLGINQKFLKHQTYTDIITFDHSEQKGHIRGDIFISVDRVIENSLKYHTTKLDELHRVIIHGVLHLCGYSDKTREDKQLMTSMENKYLNQRTF